MPDPTPTSGENLDDLFENATVSAVKVEPAATAEPAPAADAALDSLFTTKQKSTGKRGVPVLDDDEMKAIFGRDIFKSR